MRRLPALFLIAVLVAATWLIAAQPGHVTIFWQDLRIDLSVAKLIAAVLFAAVIGSLLFTLLRAVLRGPRALYRARRERRRRAGYRALTQGMVAVAAGDAEEAQRHARKADLYLADPPLTLLLSAQAAQLQGDETAARRYFTAMLERAETEFLGLRGLITIALRDGNEDNALRLTQRAHALRPKTPWVRASLLELHTRRGDWAAAQKTLAGGGKRRTLLRPKSDAETARQEAALALQRSRTADAAGHTDEALDLAETARKLAPDFAPAAAQYAELLLRAGQPGKAAKAVEVAWRRAPHPALAALYGRVYAGEAPLARLKRFERLAALNPSHLESRLAVAEAALAGQLWGEARRHLAMARESPGTLESSGASRIAAGGADTSRSAEPLPAARICRLMAALEEAEHGDTAAARAWRARASAAPPDPVWLCRHCGAESLDWQPICPRCRAFNSLVWEIPARALPPAHPVAAHPVEEIGRANNAGGQDSATPPPQGDSSPPIGMRSSAGADAEAAPSPAD